MMRDDLLGSCWAAAATIVIGSSVAASSVIVDYPALGGQAVRYALGGVALAALLRLRRRPLPSLSWREAGLLLALALTGLVGFNLFLLAALREAEPAAVGVVVGCVPVVLALAGPALRRQPPHRRVLAAAIVVSAGAVVVQGAGETTARGFLWALGALAGEAAFSLLAVPLLPRLGPLVLSTYLCVLASALLAGAAVAVDGTAALPLPGLAEAVTIGYLGVLVTGGAFIAWYGGVARIGVERAGLFAGLIPLGALFAALLVGTGTVTPLRLLGAAVVGAGVVLGLATDGVGAMRFPASRRR